MKDYQKPEFEIITLVAEEKITKDLLDGSTGVETVPPGLWD